MSTKIEWTDETWNPVRGCSIVSPGCTNCYAMRQARRHDHPGGAYGGLTQMTKGGPVWTGEVAIVHDIISWPLRRKRPSRIFVNSMSDLFHEAVPLHDIAEIFATMSLARWHTFQVLTKRPARMLAVLKSEAFATRFAEACEQALPLWRKVLQRHWLAFEPTGIPAKAPALPLPNVWLGVSVEDQTRADERRGLLERMAIEGWLTWVSYEPALGRVDWNGWEFIRWLVSGGESGPGARPSIPVWHRAARDWCAEHRIAYFFKQWGVWAPLPRDAVTDRMHRTSKKISGRMLDGRTHNEYPA